MALMEEGSLAQLIHSKSPRVQQGDGTQLDVATPFREPLPQYPLLLSPKGDPQAPPCPS